MTASGPAPGWIVFAGLGEEDNFELLRRTDYGEGQIWSHSSRLTTAHEVAPGIKVSGYSPTQINAVVPAEVSPGKAPVSVTWEGRQRVAGVLEITGAGAPPQTPSARPRGRAPATPASPPAR